MGTIGLTVCMHVYCIVTVWDYLNTNNYNHKIILAIIMIKTVQGNIIQIDAFLPL